MYKYYRKTKEGKAGRQDGKHYRFFRQLDALCGENSGHVAEANTLPISPYLHVSNSVSTQAVINREEQQSHEQIVCEGLNLSDSSGFEDSSSEEAKAFTENDHSSMSKKEDLKSQKRGRKSWKTKIKEFIELQMKKFMEMQEAWLEKMLATLDHREQERLKREEEWRKQEVERLEREHRYWTSERAWIEARDAALMEALHKMIQGDQLNNLTSEEVGAAMDQFHEAAGHDNHENENGKRNDPSLDCTINGRKWDESEVSCLIKIKANAELRFEEGGGCSEQSGLWEVISAKMNCLGYERSWKSCREKWEENANKDCNKKRKENSRTCVSSPHHNLESLYERASSGECARESDQINKIGHKMMTTGPSSSAYNSVGTVTQDGCMAFLAVGGSGESLWESYGVKLTDKDENSNC